MEHQMNLHTYKEDFSALINRTSEYLNIPEFFIEKDYWVTYVLKNLSLSKYSEQVVFKGGTSLSKAYGCIERFSEDIDLALKDPELGDAKRKNLMKQIEQAVSEGLDLIEEHPLEEKKGRNRRTFYQYLHIHPVASFSPVKDVIQLEVNTFTHPSPVESRQIETFIKKFLEENGFKEEVNRYELQPFNVQTLSIERTFCEKVLSLIRLSYEGADRLRPKIRHFYDITRIMKNITFSDSIVDTFKLALADDKNNPTFAGVWLEIPLSQAPLFKNYKTIWESLETSYTKELSSLIWNEKLPSSREVTKSINELRTLIEKI
jgi:predicted nucleotidyltransferase component of viral defense system